MSDTSLGRDSIVLAYRQEIEHYLAAADGLRALALFFDFASEFAPNFEARVLELSKRWQGRFAQGTPDGGALAGYRNEMGTLLDELCAFLSTGVAAGAPAATEAVDLIEAKKVFSRSAPQDTLVALREGKVALGGGAQRFSLGPISLNVERGEILGLVGHNGSGKTTLLRILAGDLRHSSGALSYPGLTPESEKAAAARAKRRKPPPPVIDWTAARSKIAFLTPHPQLGLEPIESALRWTAIAHGASPADADEQAQVTLHRYGLASHAGKRASALSTGLRLRFELARSLLTNPDLLVLDEPLANLDVVAQQTVLGDLQLLAASVNRPRSIIISSQHIGEIEAISDRVVVLSAGKPLFIGRKEAIAESLGVSVFEVVAENRRALVAAARQLSPLEVVELGISTVFVFPHGVTRERLMAEFTGLALSGFNDLSRSAKSLLYLDKMLAEGRIGKSAEAPHV